MKVFIANGDGTYMEGIITDCQRELSAPIRQEFFLGNGEATFSQGRRQMSVSVNAIIVNERVVLADPESATLDLTEGSVARTLIDATAQAVAEQQSELDKRAAEVGLSDLGDIEALQDRLLREMRMPPEYIRPDRSEAVPEPEPEPEPPSDTARRFSALDMDDD
jgi:hypothetical protein